METNTNTLNEQAVKIRGEFIAKWLAEGITPETIKGWANDPIKCGLINALAMLEASETALTALVQNKPESAPEKITVKSITFTYSEGYSHPSIELPYTVTTWQAADEYLRVKALTAPDTGGYDKTDFKVVMSDGDTYGGRFDLQRKHTTQKNMINRQIKETFEFHAGLHCPSHMTQADYEEYIGSDKKEIAQFKLALELWALDC